MAYQINTLAGSVLQLLDAQTNQLRHMESSINLIGQVSVTSSGPQRWRVMLGADLLAQQGGDTIRHVRCFCASEGGDAQREGFSERDRRLHGGQTSPTQPQDFASLLIIDDRTAPPTLQS